MSALERPDAPLARAFFSRRMTRLTPASVSANAMLVPITPPPITTTSAVSVMDAHPRAGGGGCQSAREPTATAAARLRRCVRERQLRVTYLVDLDHQRHSALMAPHRERLSSVLVRHGIHDLEVRVWTCCAPSATPHSCTPGADRPRAEPRRVRCGVSRPP